MRFNIKHKFILLLILSLLILFFSCSNDIKSDNYIKTSKDKIFRINYDSFVRSVSEDEITISFSELPDDLNPYLSDSDLEIFFQNALFSSLFFINPATGLPESNIVENYSFNSTITALEITLRDDVHFNNGEKLNSDDVIASLSLLYTVLLDTYIYRSFHLNNNDNIQVEKISKTKFVLYFKNSNLNILYSLANFPIIPAEIVEEIENIEDFLVYWKVSKDLKIIGSGPYVLSKLNEEEAVLSKNPYYFKIDNENNKLPYSNNIILKFYDDKNKQIMGFVNNKESDIISLSGDDFNNLYKYYIKRNEKIKFIETGKKLRKCLIVFNCYNENSKTFLLDKEIRKIVFLTIKNEIEKKVTADTSKENNITISKDLFSDLNSDGIYEYKDGNTIFLRIIVPEEDKSLSENARILEETLNNMRFEAYTEYLPYHEYLERLYYSKSYDLTFFYYDFFPGIISYYSLLNKNDLSFYPYILDDFTGSFIQDQIEKCFSAKSLKQLDIEQKKIDDYLKNNYQLCPVYTDDKYFLINDNIYNFKNNSLYENFFNLVTIETIIKKLD